MWDEEQVWVVDDDRDRHDDSSASQAEHESQADAPGPENWPLGHGLHTDEPAADA